MPQFDFFIWFLLSFYTIFIFQLLYFFYNNIKKQVINLLFWIYIMYNNPKLRIITYLSDDSVKPVVDGVIDNINSGCPGMNGVSGLIHMVFSALVMYTTCKVLDYFFPIISKDELTATSKVSEITSESPEI